MQTPLSSWRFFGLASLSLALASLLWAQPSPNLPPPEKDPQTEGATPTPDEPQETPDEPQETPDEPTTDEGWPIPSGPAPKVQFEADPTAPPEAAPDPVSSVEIVRATLRGELGHRAVRDIRRLGPGARPDFRHQGDGFAFDRPGELGFRAIYWQDGASERCLTCQRYELRKKHVLAPSWHPGGEFLVVLVQDAAARLDLDEKRLASPARSLHSELWALTADGRNAWQLTRAGESGRAVYDAVFSPEGGLVAWSERVSSAPEPWGFWVVRVATFKNLRGVPILTDVRTFEPSPWQGFVAVEGFRSDEQGLFLRLDDEHGRPVVGSYTFSTRRFEPLQTAQEGIWPADHLRSLPGTDWWIEASARGLSTRRDRLALSDLWLVTPSGRGRERLTFFNEPQTRFGLGPTQIADLAVHPQGTQLVLQLLGDPQGGARSTGPSQPSPTREALYVVELDRPALARRAESWP